MKLNARSPYTIYLSESNLTLVTIDIYIYTGTQTTDRGAIKYTITSTAYNESVTFEISAYVKDYLDTTFNGSYTCENVWVDYQTTRYISDVIQTPDAIVQLEGYDGYGYFEEGSNPQNDSGYLQSNTTLYVENGGTVVIPVNQNDVEYVRFYKDGGVVSTTNITPTTESTDQIRYAAEADVDAIDIFYNPSTLTLDVKNIEECKFTPYKLTFINKFGAKQDLWFFKRSDVSLTTSDSKYKSNLLNGGTYDTTSHQYKILDKKGNEKLNLNSGYVGEEMNEVFRQLMLSEGVWIEMNGNTLPVNVAQSSFKFEEKKNTKLINYGITVDFAYDKINNIR